MKTFKKISIWLSLSFLTMVFWIMGLMIAGQLFPGALNEVDSDTSNGEVMLFIICTMNTAVLLLFIYNAQIKGWKLVTTLFIVTFGLQYFLSQIETIWFNGALKMSHELILTIVVAGFIMNLLVSISATWLTGGFKFKSVPFPKYQGSRPKLIANMLLLAAIIWPMIYMAAGYYIAWQFEPVRIYYNGSSVMEPFYKLMIENITSGLYAFQIFRGFIWIGIGYLILISLQCAPFKKALILGLLFSVISSSQLLLPNPIMPEMVRVAHLIETSSSNFIWGFILAFVLNRVNQPAVNFI